MSTTYTSGRFPAAIMVRLDKGKEMTQQELFMTKTQNLFEELCLPETLLQAFKAVKRNKGSHGIDGLSIEKFEENLLEQLGQLREELLNWTYKPMPVRRVEIPKPGSKEPRKLGVPQVRDRVVQSGIKLLLEPILEPLFSNNSYGFRPGKSQRQAVEAAAAIVKSGKEIVVDIDLSKFFDRIDHDRLIGGLSAIVEDKRILKLIGLTLRSGVFENGKVSPTRLGTTQGSPLSPLLSNFVLNELDKELERRGLEFCRWADDANIFVKSLKAGKRVLNSITRFIETKLKLQVNGEKSKVAPSQEVKFLGMTIVKGDIAIAAKSLKKGREKLKELIRRGSHLPIERVIENFNTWYKGWSNYFSMTNFPAQLNSIEAHARRRMRSRMIGDIKRRRHLARKLISLGRKKATAFRVAYSNDGRWAMSGSLTLGLAYSKGWFSSRGLITISEEKREHWYSVKKWIKLT